MARAALFGLRHELHAGRLNRRTDTFGFMADDAEDAVRGRNSFGCSNDVQQKSAAADLVQNLGAF